jgi:hypothetical protein
MFADHSRDTRAPSLQFFGDLAIDRSVEEKMENALLTPSPWHKNPAISKRRDERLFNQVSL